MGTTTWKDGLYIETTGKTPNISFYLHITPWTKCLPFCRRHFQMNVSTLVQIVGWLNVTHYFLNHDDVIKWKHFPRYWPFVLGIHRSLVNSPHKGQWREALIFSLICVWNNSWVNNGDAGDLRHNRVHFDVIVTPMVNKSIDVFTRVTGTQWVKNLMQLQIYFGRDSDLGLILD